MSFIKTKDKYKFFKTATGEKKNNYLKRSNSYKLTGDFATLIQETRRRRNQIFNVQKENYCQSTLKHSWKKDTDMNESK